LGLKNNPSPDPAQCGKPTALGTPFSGEEKDWRREEKKNH